MAGHIVFPNIKPPRGISSLSRFFVGKLLRQELGYNGVVITDALNAGALAGLSPQTIALGAIRAGDDLLLEIGQTGVDNGKADLVTAYPAVLDRRPDGGHRDAPAERVGAPDPAAEMAARAGSAQDHPAVARCTRSSGRRRTSRSPTRSRTGRSRF